MEVKLFVALIQRLNWRMPAIITFNQHGFVGVRKLVSSERSSRSDCQIVFDKNDQMLAYAIAESDQWGAGGVRTLKVYGLSNAPKEYLVEIAPHVEKLVTSDHGAKGLFTSRQKRKEMTFADISARVMVEELVSEIESWGLKIEPRLCHHQDFPMIEFVVSKPDGTPVFIVGVDGWSGQMTVGDVWQNMLYVEPRQLRDLISRTLEANLEQLTS